MSLQLCSKGDQGKRKVTIAERGSGMRESMVDAHAVEGCIFDDIVHAMETDGGFIQENHDEDTRDSFDLAMGSFETMQ